MTFWSIHLDGRDILVVSISISPDDEVVGIDIDGLVPDYGLFSMVIH